MKLTTCMNKRHVSRQQLMAFKLNELEKLSKMYRRSSSNTNLRSTDVFTQHDIAISIIMEFLEIMAYTFIESHVVDTGKNRNDLSKLV